jgi:hypothetical protein
MKSKKDPRKATTLPIADVLKDFLVQNNMEDKYEAVQIVAAWPKLMGDAIAKRTVELFVKDRKLYVKLNSAPLKHQLFQGRDKIVTIYSEHFNKDVIEEVVFLQ